MTKLRWTRRPRSTEEAFPGKPKTKSKPRPAATKPLHVKPGDRFIRKGESAHITIISVRGGRAIIEWSDGRGDDTISAYGLKPPYWRRASPPPAPGRP